MLRSMHQTTQQQLTLAQPMLHEMQHRYDRLLEAPHPAASPPTPRSPMVDDAPRGEIRRRIVALLRDHPEGLSPVKVRQVLGLEKNLANTMKAMARDGLLQRVATGRYTVA
jgi:hypothetical protein